MVTKEYLQKLTRPELSQYSREHGIKGYSGKTKVDRIKLILNYKKPKKQYIKSKKRKLTDIGVKWEDTDKLVKKIKAGQRIEFSDFEGSISVRHEGVITGVNMKAGSILVKPDNKQHEIGVSFAFYQNDDGLAELVFTSLKKSSFSSSMMKMMKKSGGGNSPFSKK